MHSDRGGGHMGFTGAIMPQAQYLVYAGTIAWVDPVAPPPLAPINGETAPQITERNRLFLADQTEHRQFVLNMNALRKLILDFVDEVHYMHLRNPVLGFGQVHPRDIMQHLLATYATVTADELNSNQARLNDPWDPSEPIAALWVRQTEIQAFAQPHDPISWNTITRATVTLFDNSGVFPEAIRDWRRRTPANQTWANLQQDFNYADRELRRRATVNNFANLATTAIASQQQARYAAVGIEAVPVHIPQANAALAAVLRQNPHYCFTHGVTWDGDHTSQCCNHPCEGHQREATFFNMMGGNNTIRRQPGERPHPQAQPRRRRPGGRPAAAGPAPAQA
jgi:hypothetical protein